MGAARGAAAAAAAAATPAAASAAAVGSAVARGDVLTGAPGNNIPESIFDRMNRNLHRTESHPLGIIKAAIQEYFEGRHPGEFRFFDDLRPIVKTEANFDELLIPEDHVSRSPNDTYYVGDGTVLRCHTSAHQAELLRGGHAAFTCTGDVYRRDTIDATHYPVFHQMEGVRVFEEDDWGGEGDGTAHAEAELRSTLEGLAKHLFGDVECRWVDAYFPFTEPSIELEIFYRGEWLEVLGCGVMRQEILEGNLPAGASGKRRRAWAFGLGLERLAMVLFGIPDIRLFWSGDERFLSQFKAGDLTTQFQPYSKYPPCNKDMAFWLSDAFTENNLCEVVRGVAGDLCEEVKLIDEFTNPKLGRTSHCYRVVYRSMDRSLTNEEIDALQERVREEVVGQLGVELR